MDEADRSGDRLIKGDLGAEEWTVFCSKGNEAALRSGGERFSSHPDDAPVVHVEGSVLNAQG